LCNQTRCSPLLERFEKEESCTQRKPSLGAPACISNRQLSSSIGSLDSLLLRVINEELEKHGAATIATTPIVDDETELVDRFDTTMRVSPEDHTAADSNTVGLLGDLQRLDPQMSQNDLLVLVNEYDNDASACRAVLRQLQRVLNIKR